MLVYGMRQDFSQRSVTITVMTRVKFNCQKTIKIELENFDTLGLVKPDFSRLGSLDLQIWEPEYLAKGPSLAPEEAMDMVRVGNPKWTAKDEYVLFQR